MLRYKEVLNRLETESPGTKQRFYWEFLEKEARGAANRSSTASSMEEKDRRTLHSCATCGQPTTADICFYCKMMAKAKFWAKMNQNNGSARTKNGRSLLDKNYLD